MCAQLLINCKLNSDYLILIQFLEQALMVFASAGSPRHKGHKYNKITQQKKFHLLSLIFKDRLPIREAASTAGINYLTAKTIMFFHKNNCKSYRFDIEKPREGRLSKCVTASFSTIKRITDINDKLIKPKSRIQVICSIGNVLSPPKEEQANSPTTCSNHQDIFITKQPEFYLEKIYEIPISFSPMQIVGQGSSTFGLKQLMQRRFQSAWKKDMDLPAFPIQPNHQQ